MKTHPNFKNLNPNKNVADADAIYTYLGKDALINQEKFKKITSDQENFKNFKIELENIDRLYYVDTNFLTARLEGKIYVEMKLGKIVITRNVGVFSQYLYENYKPIMIENGKPDNIYNLFIFHEIYNDDDDDEEEYYSCCPTFANAVFIGLCLLPIFTVILRVLNFAISYL